MTESSWGRTAALAEHVADEMEAAPKLAKSIRLVQQYGKNRQYLLEVDGKPFPWLVGAHIGVPVFEGECPMIQIDLLAESVQVVNSFGADGG